MNSGLNQGTLLRRHKCALAYLPRARSSHHLPRLASWLARTGQYTVLVSPYRPVHRKRDHCAVSDSLPGLRVVAHGGSACLIQASAPLLTRQCACRLRVDDATTLTWSHLAVGGSLALYNRVYHLYACDDFTRHFMHVQGLPQEPNQPAVLDPFHHRQQEKENLTELAKSRILAQPREPDSKAYLANARKVCSLARLRLTAHPDCHAAAGGSSRRLLLEA